MSGQHHDMEVGFTFREDTYQPISNRIVAIIGKMFCGSTLTIGFSFHTSEEREAAIQRLVKCSDGGVHGENIVAYRTNSGGNRTGLVGAGDVRRWVCECGSATFELEENGSVVCSQCCIVQGGVKHQPTLSSEKDRVQ